MNISSIVKPMQQWVLSVPKRPRYFLQRDVALQGAVLRIFLSEVERCLREHSPGCDTQVRIGAVAFIHRFSSSFNEHVHFQCCIVDGVFESAANADDGAEVDFHAAAWIDEVAITKVQAEVRRLVLRTFVRRGLFDKGDAEVMGGWVHGGGFSVNASVCINEKDRAGLERLLRYCARAPFALEHLQQLDTEHLVYHSPKPGLDGTSDLVLTPLELIGKIAALVPPPRSHRHRYFGVLAPNSLLRAAVIALAPIAVIAPTLPLADAEDKPRRAASHYLWAMLLARIYEAFPLNCPICQAQMRIIAFINEASDEMGLARGRGRK